jgi:hypothetical protein
MKPSSCKAKGRKAAKEVKALILMLFPELTPDDVIVASSGQTGEDLILSARARGLLPVSIECKNVEALNIWNALSQAESNSKDWQPLLMFRRNRSKLYAAMEAAELLALLKIRALYDKSISMDDAPKAKNGLGN